LGGAGIDKLVVIAAIGADYQLPSFDLQNWTTTANPANSDMVSLVGICRPNLHAESGNLP